MLKRKREGKFSWAHDDVVDAHSRLKLDQIVRIIYDDYVPLTKILHFSTFIFLFFFCVLLYHTEQHLNSNIFYGIEFHKKNFMTTLF